MDFNRSSVKMGNGPKRNPVNFGTHLKRGLKMIVQPEIPTVLIFLPLCWGGQAHRSVLEFQYNLRKFIFIFRWTLSLRSSVGLGKGIRCTESRFSQLFVYLLGVTRRGKVLVLLRPPRNVTEVFIRLDVSLLVWLCKISQMDFNKMSWYWCWWERGKRRNLYILVVDPDEGDWGLCGKPFQLKCLNSYISVILVHLKCLMRWSYKL